MAVGAVTQNERRRSLGVLLCGVSSLLVGCDASVTSVGSLEPIVKEPEPEPEPPEPEPEPEPLLGQYLEAENGELSGGFAVVSDASASNGAYLQPPLGIFSDEMPGQARARYVFTVPEDATYRIWGRIYSPNATNNRFWFQVDGGTWYRWRISTGEIWFWDALHDNLRYNDPLDFPLTAGTHELIIANCASGTQLDRLYVTANGDEPPGNATPCRPPHSIEVAGECLPSCGSHANPTQGETTCQANLCQNQPLLDAYDCNICCFVASTP